MELSTLISTIKKDFSRLEKTTKVGIIKTFFTQATFRQIILFRIGTFLKENKRILCVFFLPYIFIKIWYKQICYKTGIQLNLGTKIGGGIHFAHYSCIVINKKSVIGENCTIYQGVTLGTTSNTNGLAPIIGNNCIIWAGAKIIGAVTIGDFAEIGANAVVTHHIPQYGIAVGIPAKIIKLKTN